MCEMVKLRKQEREGERKGKRDGEKYIAIRKAQGISTLSIKS